MIDNKLFIIIKMDRIPRETLSNIGMYTGQNNLPGIPTIYFDQQLFQPNVAVNPMQVTNLKITDPVQLHNIGQFVNLLELDCSNIQLMGKLPKLPKGIQRLNCRENEIEELPKIDSLLFLDCCYNNIKKLPKLKNLKILRVDINTDISTVENNPGIEIQIIDEKEINRIFGESLEFGNGRYYRI